MQRINRFNMHPEAYWTRPCSTKTAYVMARKLRKYCKYWDHTNFPVGVVVVKHCKSDDRQDAGEVQEERCRHYFLNRLVTEYTYRSKNKLSWAQSVHAKHVILIYFTKVLISTDQSLPLTSLSQHHRWNAPSWSPKPVLKRLALSWLDRGPSQFWNIYFSEDQQM